MTPLMKEFDLWVLNKRLDAQRQLHSILTSWGQIADRLIAPEFFKKDAR